MSRSRRCWPCPHKQPPRPLLRKHHLHLSPSVAVARPPSRSPRPTGHSLSHNLRRMVEHRRSQLRLRSTIIFLGRRAIFRLDLTRCLRVSSPVPRLSNNNEGGVLPRPTHPPTEASDGQPT